MNLFTYLAVDNPAADPTAQLDSLERFLLLMEKFGVMAVFVVVFGAIIWGFLRAMRNGDLVPKEQLLKVEAERDEAQKQVQELTAIMNRERERIMEPLLGTLSNLKKDSEEERGGG